MSEHKFIQKVTIISGVVLAVVLATASIYGIDLANMFFGIGMEPHDRTGWVIEGIVVSVALLFGATFTAGVLAWLTLKPQKTETPQNKPAE